MTEDAQESRAGSALADFFRGWNGPLLLFILVVCVVGLMFWLYPSRLPNQQEMSALGKVSALFLDHLEAGRHEDAYALTTDDYRRRLDREQFDAFVKKAPALTRSKEGYVSGFSMRGSRPPLRVEQYYKRKLEDGSMVRVTFVLVGENELWQVDDVTVGPLSK